MSLKITPFEIMFIYESNDIVLSDMQLSTMRLRGTQRQRGRHRRESRAVRTADVVGRRPMMTSSVSSGRLLMKSRLAGCGFGSSRLRLLVALLSISTGGDAGVHVCWCVLCAGCARVRPSVHAAA